MKLKQKPEDFLVKELSAHPTGETGRYALFRLKKEGIDTLKAVQIAAARLRVKPAQVRYAGLKDAHAATEQLISVPFGKQWRDGAPREVIAQRFTLTYVGRSEEHVTPQSITGNQFTITLRDLKPPDTEAIARAAEPVKTYGIPNYYDSQRFGQLRGGGGYIGKMLVTGDYEGALKAAIATPARKDRSKIKTIRRTIRDHWGDWDACATALPKSTERSVVTYLRTHPTDFAGAFERLPRGLRLLLVSAYQSMLWNRIACSLIERHCGADRVIRFRHESGEILFHADEAPDMLADLEIPALRPNTELQPPYEEPYRRLLESEGVTQDGFRLKGLKATYFPKSSRRLIVIPEQFRVSAPAPDALNPGRTAITLHFTLPRGSYATLVVKRLAAGKAPQPFGMRDQ